MSVSMNKHQVAQLVFETIHAFGMEPEDVNEGYCEDFAEQLAGKIPGAVVLWPSNPLLAYVHAYVLYDGRYYDSEEPQGVEDWMDLPCFQRFFDSRPEWDKQAWEVYEAACKESGR